MGALIATYKEAKALGCVLAVGFDNEDYQLAAHHGDPCRGRSDGFPCRAFDGGKCPCYRAYHTVAMARQAGSKITVNAATIPNHDGLVGGNLTGLSIAAIAAKLGVSKNKARKLKMQGDLKQGIPGT